MWPVTIGKQMSDYMGTNKGENRTRTKGQRTTRTHVPEKTRPVRAGVWEVSPKRTTITHLPWENTAIKWACLNALQRMSRRDVDSGTSSKCCKKRVDRSCVAKDSYGILRPALRLDRGCGPKPDAAGAHHPAWRDDGDFDRPRRCRGVVDRSSAWHDAAIYVADVTRGHFGRLDLRLPTDCRVDRGCWHHNAE